MLFNGFIEGRHTHAHSSVPSPKCKKRLPCGAPLDGFVVTLECDHLDGKTAVAIMQGTSFCAALIRKFGLKHDGHA